MSSSNIVGLSESIRKAPVRPGLKGCRIWPGATEQAGDPGPAPRRVRLWDEAEVKARLEEAAETLKAMSLGVRDRPARLMARWPDVVRQACEAYGYQDVWVRPPAPPPARISRADEAVTWLLWLDETERRVTWARASGIPWRRLEDIDGRSHVTLRKFQAAALARICKRLNLTPFGPGRANGKPQAEGSGTRQKNA